MLLWFLVLAISGAASIVRNAGVLAAVNPVHAFRFLSGSGFAGLYILGAVFLVVTGSEALYADIGHLGRRPIRLAWFTVVFPSLLLNYFGQGALLLEDQSFAGNPFYHLVPAGALYPMVVLATGATVIASQAVISGVFSLTFQALQLGYLPRMLIRHTSEEEKGQIFIPRVNWILFAFTAAIVVGFQSSGNLAAAYGVAVTATMVITTVLGYFVLRDIVKWPLPAALGTAAFFLAIDLSFFSANILKIVQGGWLPLVAAATLYVLMSSWYEGRRTIARQIRAYVQPLRTFIDGIDHRSIKKVRGTAIYLTENPLCAPLAFVHNLKHNRVVHERNIFVSFGTKKVPHIRAEDRVKIARLPEGSYRVLARYGFMDRFDIRAVMRILDNKHLRVDVEDATFFVGQNILIPTKSVGMSLWRDKLYVFMWRNSERATSYFNIPPERAFEIGAHIKI